MGVMNFLVLPPEINSARMYLGAGSAPYAGGGGLGWVGGRARFGGSSFGSVTSGLAGASVAGSAAVAMAEVAAPYVGWLSASAAQAEEAAAQARTAASAFEAAVSATVHPGAVAANRLQL